jgi:hypothetical protein
MAPQDRAAKTPAVSIIVRTIVREHRHMRARNETRWGTQICAKLAKQQRQLRSSTATLSFVKASGLTKQDRQPSICIATCPLGPAFSGQCAVRRRITPEAGRGLEKLGHALEYLADEFLHDGCRFAEDSGRVQAIQLLASLNRQIYLACGVEPGIRQRVQTLVRRLFRQPSLNN